MHSPVFIASLAASLVAGLGAFMPRAQQPVERLSRVFEQDATTPADAWRARLTERDLAQRERNFDSLLEAARGDAQLRRTLEQWAADASDPELGWTARLALRELTANPLSWLDARYPLGGGATAPFGGNGLIDAAQLLEQFESQWRALHDSWPSGLNAVPQIPGGGSSSSAESFNLSVGPDGVKCEVRRNVDGSEEVKTYQAESMDELLEANPELREKLNLRGLGAGASAPWGFDAFQPRMWRFQVDPFGNNAGADTLRTDILGVLVLPLSEGDRKELGLDSGVGLRIERVEPGTIARSMGLQRGHVLIELNGRKLQARDDITEELKKRGPDGALEAVVIDSWGQRRTHTWKPDPGRRL